MTAHVCDAESTSRVLRGEKQLRYHLAGSGPALLLIHGSGPGVSAWANFGELFPKLAGHFTVIAPDLPGYGDSYIPDLEGDYASTALDAVRRVLQAERIEHADVVGNSLGGMVGFRLAFESPELVGKLVAMGPGGIGFPVFGPQPTEGIRRLAEFTFDPTREKLEAWMQSMVGDPAFLTEARIEDRWQAASAPESLEFTRAFYTAALTSLKSGSHTQPLWSRLAEISHEVLLVYGRDDRVTPLESAFVPLRLLRNVELHVFANAGHWVMLEQPDAFIGVIMEFLQRDRAQVSGRQS